MTNCPVVNCDYFIVHCEIAKLQRQASLYLVKLQRLWQTLQTKTFRFHKVAAHSDFWKTTDKSMAYHQMGNQVANDRAIWACWNLQKTMIQDWVGQCRWVEQQQYNLEQLYKLHLQLFTARTQLAKHRQTEQDHARHTSRHDILDIFCNWTITTIWTPPTTRLDLTGESTWGPFIAGKFKEWHSMIKWPHDSVGFG